MNPENSKGRDLGDEMIQIRALVARHGTVADNKALTSIFASHDRLVAALREIERHVDRYGNNTGYEIEEMATNALAGK